MPDDIIKLIKSFFEEEKAQVASKDGPSVYKDTLKEERKTKLKRDFVDKDVLLSELLEYINLQERMLEKKRMSLHQRNRFFELRDVLMKKYRLNF